MSEHNLSSEKNATSTTFCSSPTCLYYKESCDKIVGHYCFLKNKKIIGTAPCEFYEKKGEKIEHN